MYEPNIRTTETLINSLNTIEDVREILGTIPVLPIVEESIQRQALVETVYYTARIEGNPLNMRVAERLHERQVSKPIVKNEQEFVNIYQLQFCLTLKNLILIYMMRSMMRSTKKTFWKWTLNWMINLKKRKI